MNPLWPPLFVLLLAAACGSPRGEDPPPPTEPETAAPTPAQTAEVVVERELLDARMQIRIFTAASGQQEASDAADSALTEAERVFALPADSRELLNAARGPYAVDRAADTLVAAAMTDFLVTLADTFRARGSQDGSLDRGWRVAVPGRDGAPPIGTVALRDAAMHTARDAGIATSVAPSASASSRVAIEAAAKQRFPLPDLPRGFALHVIYGDQVAKDAAFADLLEGMVVIR